MAHIILLLEVLDLVRDFWVVKGLGLVLYFVDLRSEIRGVRPLVQDHTASW